MNDQLKQIVAPLLEWYRRCARELSWRSDPTPYRVWVSEIMLQQTRVEAVKPYYERFMEQLPTVQALAEAEEEKLLKLWEGLGYYSRVRNLQKAAKVVMDMAGNPRWSRVVGYALHVNPDPDRIPCFRVVNRFGEVSSAFAFGGENRQIGLLRQEGVTFLEEGRVDLKKHQWDGISE